MVPAAPCVTEGTNQHHCTALPEALMAIWSQNSHCPRFGSPKRTAVPLDSAPGSPSWQQAQELLPAGLVPSEPVAASVVPDSLSWQIGRRAPTTWRLGSPCQQHYHTALLESMPGKQAPEFLLPEDLVALCLQQLLWLLEVDPRASAALWISDNLGPLALLPHGYLQLVTQCQEPTTIHLRNQGLLFCWQRGFPPNRAWGASTSHCPWQQESPCFPIKEQEHQIHPLKGGKL
jgi:hypothetical protein